MSFWFGGVSGSATTIKAAWYKEVSSGTTGTVAIPEGGSVTLDQFASGVDAICCGMSGAGGFPTWAEVQESDGTIVAATLDENGNYTLTGAPAAYPVAVVFIYVVSFSDYDASYSLIEHEVPGSRLWQSYGGDVRLITAADIDVRSQDILNSGQITLIDSAVKAPLSITERATEPSSPVTNDIYLDNGTNTTSGNPGFRRYTGAIWEDVAESSASVSPGGSNTQVQFNDSGSFGGDSGLVFNKSTNVLTANQYKAVNGIVQPPLNITARSSAPNVPASEDIYLDTGSNTLSGNPGFRRYTGTSWEDLHIPSIVRDAVRNLVIKNNSSNPNYQIDVTADEIVLQDSDNVPYVARSVSLTIDITGTGANKLDTGSEASSTWYHIWIICNGTTVAGLFSTSDSAPTMPSGYTYKAYVGAVYNKSDSNFDTLYQLDNIATPVLTSPVLSNGTATSYTSVDCSAKVPTTARWLQGESLIQNTSGDTAVGNIASTSTGIGEEVLYMAVAFHSGVGFYSFYMTMLVESQTLYYKVGSPCSMYIRIHRWFY